MLLKTSHRLPNLIDHTQIPSVSYGTDAFFEKKLNRSSVSLKKSQSPIVAAVAAPTRPSRPITRHETVLQSSRAKLDRPVLYSDNMTEGKDDNIQLADMWNEIQGSNHWNGMLNPIHPLLLSEIIRYGVFVRASYEAFDLEPKSKFYGTCKYGQESMFGQLGMQNCGYRVTKYIYAAAPDVNLPDFLKNNLKVGDGSNWIGYVAVSADEDEIKRLGRRDIVVAMRGTVTQKEWLANLMHALTPARLNPLDSREDVMVETGFLGLYTTHDSACRFNNGSAREQLLCEISRLVKKYKGEKLSITLTGHSMGSALATLCAYDIAELELNREDCESCSRIPITVYSFAGPRVGNTAFKDRCDELGLRILRVVNVHDVVTMIPGVIFNENFRLWQNVKDRNPWTYSHVGVELALDHKSQKQFLKREIHNPSCIHDLATYLQLLTCCHHHRDHVHQNDQHTHDHQLDYERIFESGSALIRQLSSFFFDLILSYPSIIFL